MAKTKRQREKRKIQYSDAKRIVKEHDVGFKPTAFRLPEGVSLFKFSKEKTYKLDIIPYFVGEGNPYADEGLVHYERTYYVHRGVGADNETVCCLKDNFGKKCPICEYRQKLNRDPDGDSDLEKQLRPKERQLWLIRDHDELEKGVQIMETPHYKGFGEMLSSKLKASDDDDNYYDFYKLDGGMYLKVSVEEDTFEKRTYFKPTNIEMKARKKPLPEELLEEAPCLDELLVELEYDELKSKFMQTDDEEDDESPTKKSSKKPSGKSSGGKVADTKDDDEDEDDEDEDDNEDKEPKKGDIVEFTYKGKKRKGKVVRFDEDKDLLGIKCDDRTEPYNIDVDEVAVVKVADGDDDEDDDDEEAPPKGKGGSKGGKKSSKASKDDEEDDDDEDDEDEDEDEDDGEYDIDDFEKGQVVKFERKGKQVTADVEKVDTKKELVSVFNPKDPDKPIKLKPEDILEIIKAAPKKKDDDDEDEDDDEEEESPKAGKKSSKSSKKASKPSDDDEDEEDDDEDEDDEDDDD